MTDKNRLAALLTERFGEPAGGHEAVAREPWLTRLAGRRSVRRYRDAPVDPALIRELCALALCAPSKSDLQQRDIVVVEDSGQRAALDALVPDMPWIAEAPAYLVFCGNNRRQRQLHQWRGRAFANDHFDAVFNAAVDAGIALATFVLAAEAVGLGCCPISAVRNEAERASEILVLPDWVFPVAGLTLGWPAEAGELSLRLPLSATVHGDRFSDADIERQVAAYDARRAAAQPYAKQRFVEDYGSQDDYGWSEDKARQYSEPERASFGAYVRKRGFDLR